MCPIDEQETAVRKIIADNLELLVEEGVLDETMPLAQVIAVLWDDGIA